MRVDMCNHPSEAKRLTVVVFLGLSLNLELTHLDRLAGQ